DMLVRRITISAADITDESLISDTGDKAIQLELFSTTDVEAGIMHQKRERLLQEAMLKIKKAYGKNSILKGLNFAEGATQRLRNRQIGGHHE
ncbi:MAG: DNA methylase, partial [Paramuribaculum sp.]|nr:DNA methylase [Paramuribaculum sp.]